MIAAVELPLRFQQQMRDEALRAFPRECCGLVEGCIEAQTARVVALHPVANVAAGSDHFEIDSSAHFALLRQLRGTEQTIIGCYHSHPNGRAEPSARDRESADESGFLWLIAAGTESVPDRTRIAAFASTGKAFRPINIRLI